MSEQKRAVALISGGLDSMLAAKVIMDQGIYVEGINFYTGFCVEGHTSAIRNHHKTKKKRNNALWVAETLGIKLHILDVVEEYKEVLLSPKHGYGQNLNPCLDCKIFMVKKSLAWSFMKENGFDFIITGEVMGQRPKSQRKATLPIIARESGAEDLLVRPLSAKHLPETLPEQKGWIDRSALYSFHGRNRKPQIKLAKALGLADWSQPAGGCCFLTNKGYSSKLSDLWTSRHSREYDLDDIILLKIGRHIRPDHNFKLIIARDEGESNYLKGYKSVYDFLTTTSHNGPNALIDGIASRQQKLLAAQIIARYSQGRSANEVTVQLTSKESGISEALNVKPFEDQGALETWHV